MRLFLLVLPAVLLGSAGAGRFGAAAPAMPAPLAPAGTGTLSLAPLWQVDAGGNPSEVHNGFFNHERQRLEMVFLGIERDGRNLNLYHVRGKDRRYRKVKPFVGTFSFASVQLGAPRQQGNTSGNGQEKVVPGLATGTFVLKETAPASDHSAGTFQGTMAVDFLVMPDKSVVFNPAPTGARTRQAGMLLEGRWTAATGAATSSVLVQNGNAVIGSGLMPRFDIGDRGQEINPRYTRVGWDTLWENEEWWAGKAVSRR